MGKMNGRAKRKRGGFDPSSGRPYKTIKTEAKGLRVINEKLGSSAIGEFLPALHSLGALAGDGSDSASAILQFGADRELVHQLLPFLSYQDNSVQLAAAGALRNLSSYGKEQHNEQLLECGVLQPLCLLLSKECNATDTVELHEQHAVLEQAAYILYNLCELSAAATETASESAVPALLQHVHKTQPALPATACLAVHTALLCLTENNPKACIDVERHSDQLERIVVNYSADGDTDGLTLHDAITVAGILTNLGKCEVRSSIVNSVMGLISRALSLTPAGLLQQHVVVTPNTPIPTVTDEMVASPGAALAELNRINLQGASNSGHAPLQEDSMGDGQDEEKEGNATSEAAAKELVMHLQHHAESKDGAAAQDTGAITAAAWKTLQHLLGAQQIALELLNNLCCGDDDESYDEASGTLKQKGLVKWAEEESFMEEEDNQWEHTDDVTDLVEVLQPVLLQHGVFERILEILQPVDPAVLQALQGSKYNCQLQALLSGVRGRGLATLQAVIECQEADQLGGPAKLFQCWTDIARLAFQEGKFEGEEELEGATGAMRAIIAKFGPEDSHHLAAITQQDLKVELKSAGAG